MEKLDLVIDVQGFHNKDGDFIPKEIAVIGVDCNFVSHWLIKPPYNYSDMSRGIIATNSYLTCYHHGIEWFDGESNLADVYNTLKEVTRGALRIYTRGTQKVDLLEKIVARQIVNLEDYQCPSFKNLPQTNDHYCFYHGYKKDNFACALTYAYKLKYWLIKTLYVSSEFSPDEIDLKKKRKKSEDVCGGGEKNMANDTSKIHTASNSNVDLSKANASTANNALDTSASGIVTSTTTGAVHKPPRNPSTRANRQSTYGTDAYEKAGNNEYASDKACAHTRASADNRSFSGRQDTVCTSETVCGCS